MSLISWSNLPRHDPEVRTIAHYKRSYAVLTSGAIVAASSKYIGYALRGGLIRVIHRESESMVLLRGLTKDPSEIRFCPATTDVLAAVANDASVCVWQLSCSTDGVTAAVLLHATWGKPSINGPSDRLCFQPAAAPDVLATSLGGAVIQLWDLTTQSPESASSPLILLRQEEGLPPVSCFDFDPSGLALVCADASGAVTSYLLPACEETYYVKAHDSAVAMLTHCSAEAPLLVSAGRAGYEIKLWRVDGGAPVCIHALRLEQPSPNVELICCFDAASALLLLSHSTGASNSQNTMLLSRLVVDASDPSQSTFGDFAAVHAEMGIMSCCPLPTPGSDKVEVFCVQASTVQCISLVPADLLPTPIEDTLAGVAASLIADLDVEDSGPAADTPIDGLLSHLQRQMSNGVSGPPSAAVEPQAPPPPPAGGAPRAPLPSAAARAAGLGPGLRPVPQAALGAPRGPVPPPGPNVVARPPPPMHMGARTPYMHAPPPPPPMPFMPSAPPPWMEMSSKLDQLDAHVVSLQQQLHKQPHKNDLDARLARIEQMMALQAEKTEANAARQLQAHQDNVKFSVQALLPGLQAAVDKAVDTAMDKAMKHQEKLVHKLEESIMTKVNESVNKATSLIAASTAAVPSALTTQLSGALDPAVRDAFKTTFETSLLPGFERAAQKMYEDLHKAFKKGLQEFNEPLSAQVQEQCTSLSTSQAQLMTQAQTSLSQMIADAKDSFSKAIREAGTSAQTASAAKPLGTASSGGAPPRSPPPDFPSSDIALGMELQKAISEGQYERAFAQALGASNLDVLLWLCAKVDPKLLMSTGSPSLQIVLASLVQQLSWEPTKDTSLKLSWLHQILSNLRPSDPLISANCARILTQVDANLRQSADALGDGPTASAFNMVLFMVRKLMQNGTLRG